MKKALCLVLLRSLQGGSKFRCWFAARASKYAFDVQTRTNRVERYHVFKASRIWRAPSVMNLCYYVGHPGFRVVELWTGVAGKHKMNKLRLTRFQYEFEFVWRWCRRHFSTQAK